MIKPIFLMLAFATLLLPQISFAADSEQQVPKKSSTSEKWTDFMVRTTGVGGLLFAGVSYLKKYGAYKQYQPAHAILVQRIKEHIKLTNLKNSSLFDDCFSFIGRPATIIKTLKEKIGHLSVTERQKLVTAISDCVAVQDTHPLDVQQTLERVLTKYNIVFYDADVQQLMSMPERETYQTLNEALAMVQQQINKCQSEIRPRARSEKFWKKCAYAGLAVAALAATSLVIKALKKYKAQKEKNEAVKTARAV